METRWRVPAGRTLENTKVSERIKELHLSGERLNRIKEHLTRNERIKDERDRENARTAKIKEISDGMTKNWKDSVQRQQAAHQAELEEMLTKQDDSNFVRFLSVRKEQEAERNLYVNEVKQVLLKRKEFPKVVGSAYLLSEVLYEREKQKEFAQMMKDHQADVAKQEVDDMWEDIAKYTAQEAEKRQQQFEKNQIYATELLSQVEEIQQARALEHEEKIKEELLDQERGRREEQHIEEMRQKKIADGRRQALQAMNEFRNMQIKEREQTQLEAHTSEVTMKVMQKSRDRIQAMMKKKDREMQEARLARGLSAFDNSKQLKHDNEMRLMYERGMARFKAIEEEHDEYLHAKAVRLKQERVDEQERHNLMKEAAEKNEEEMKKWLMLNRFKSTELEKQCIEDELQKKVAAQRAKLKGHLEEIASKAGRMKSSDADEVRLFHEKNERHDKEYMEYAEEVKELAAANGWSTAPIEKVINKYKQDVMGEKAYNRCDELRKQGCANKLHSVTTAGKRTHCPASDPSAKCKHQKERVLN